MNPFAALVDIARRSQRAAKELPAEKASQTHWTGIGFSLLDSRFVVDLNDVAELMRIPNLTGLPEVKLWVAGVANVRGRLLTILDLAAFFGQGSNVARSQRRILVVDRDEFYTGFLVDESLGMQYFPSDSFQPDPGEVDEKYHPFLTGSYLVAGAHWPVMNLVSFLQDSRFQNLAEG
ncbi:MAG: chemotaxis protein CheW [Pseudomonadales bacterium]|jgi:twitching motility protein PilI|nr:chemotaxis protein CheW [Pseudomonadales bacterium]MDP7359061.1 chemotaxis protein CheW [Pseudomonadales bacterium]HJN52144.1 chemotaxis protein CheW [Pseudomonadales bacterium]|tara:strand:- start:4273 stop:4803 length:531 start_codon:yes stop_codon:yes gene_type:complete